MSNPKYSIYIISKGRAKTRYTSKTLEEMNVPYKIVVEPSEYEEYAKVINKNKILTLPDNFSTYNQGSIPARNWVWEHSLSQKETKHWIMDDNIQGFVRFHNNTRIKVADGTILKAMEDFTDRYENIAFSGPNYRYFVDEKKNTIKPYTLNTRIYSCILVNNFLPFKWRGKYNEDTDICLRALKQGYNTILFNTFLQNKVGTLKMKGGNTDTIYNKTNKRQEFAQSLKQQHPDIVKIVWRYNRWHHEVDYSKFTQKLKRKQNITLKNEPNNYGMKLINIKQTKLR